MTWVDRFVAKVRWPSDASDCWLWTAGTNGDGYGSFSIERRSRGAHRVAYLSIRGPIPEGLELDHLCRTRNCVNPWHLQPVPRKTNILRGDGLAARRMALIVVTGACEHGYLWPDQHWIKGAALRHGRWCQGPRTVVDLDNLPSHRIEAAARAIADVGPDAEFEVYAEAAVRAFLQETSTSVKVGEG